MIGINKSIEQVVLLNYVKYSRLQELINYTYTNSTATEINIYMDIYPIIRSIYSDQYNVSYNSTMDIVPLLINMCAHYRYFFKKYYSVYANIYMVAGRNLPQVSTLLVPEYNYTMSKREYGPAHAIMDNMMRTSFDIMKVLAPYLPNIYFVETEFETSVAIGYIISKQTNLSVPNLVISKDIYGIQLVTSNRFQNTSFIMPFKTMGDNNELNDLSIVLKHMDYKSDWKDFWDFYFHHKKIKFSPNVLIDPINITPLMSISGFQERALKSLMQLPTAYNMIEKIIGDANTQCTINSIYDEFHLDDKIPRHVVDNRFHCLDIVYQIDTIYNSSSEALLMSFENKHDPETVKNICNKYFVNIPISLDKL